MTPQDQLLDDRFPRSNAYHSDWVIGSASGGANSLWLTEWLTSDLDLKPGMNVLDLGCGLAASSIFLAHEFGVTVWATDLWFSPSDNLPRIVDAGCEGKVFPIHSDARSLPFAKDFFDAILSIDSFPYYGTDDHYLSYLARFVKPGRPIAIAGAGLTQEIEDALPPHMANWWIEEPAMWCVHSPPWWQRHWERSGIVDVELADNMPDGWRYWLKWHRIVAPDNHTEIQALENDAGEFLGYSRVIARRRPEAKLEDPIVSIPSEYAKSPLLRTEN